MSDLEQSNNEGTNSLVDKSEMEETNPLAKLQQSFSDITSSATNLFTQNLINNGEETNIINDDSDDDYKPPPPPDDDNISDSDIESDDSDSDMDDVEKIDDGENEDIVKKKKWE